MRCMFAGSYLGRTQWSELAVLRRDLYVRRQRMRRNDLQGREKVLEVHSKWAGFMCSTVRHFNVICVAYFADAALEITISLN